MIRLLIERKWPKAGYTVGRFYADGQRLGESLEDTDRGLSKNMGLQTILGRKVYGATAVPKGTYKVTLSYSPKFAQRVWGRRYDGLVPEILDVPGFAAVRIHPGTSAKDTEGCPLIGKNKVVGQLRDSQATYFQLMDNYLVPAFRRGEDITITIA